MEIGNRVFPVDMKSSWISIWLVAGLLGLLAVLAAFQYAWLGQISDAEKDRLQKRLQTDSQRLAEDFNREIQNAYFNFQSDEQLWKEKDWAQFNERYRFWREKTAYPDLIKNFYYIENKPDSTVLGYDRGKSEFVETVWTDELKKIKSEAFSSESDRFNQIDSRNFVLVMPVYEQPKTFERILIRKETTSGLPPKIDPPEKKGVLVIRLDEAVIKEQILPDLAKKHFPDNDFKLAVRDEEGNKIFQTQEVAAADTSVKLFDLSPDNLLFFSSREQLPRTQKTDANGMIVKQKVESTVSTLRTTTIKADGSKIEAGGSKTFQIELNGEKPRTVIQTGSLSDKGRWTLDVQHSAGSLDKYISGTRNKNLGISFGILGLLAVSVVLIFVSAQRAKLLAQRQINFVSSVSHEFRTPLAVICSAGENLADGVTKERQQVSRYGDLIKSEGRKLSAMVEQILEFAGANSGRKKYDLREQNVGDIIESALTECRPQIIEKGFSVETDLAENLPVIKADAAALSRAVQNLIFNSLKYSNGEKWLKVSAENGQGRVKIVVEDHGIGIAPADLKHIFEPFYRAKAVVDEQIHGNGLGLSLVKETIEAHGGRISAESEPGKGSRFIVQLPTGN